MTCNHVPVNKHCSLKVGLRQGLFEIFVDLISHELSLVTMDTPNIEVHMRTDHMIVPQ